MIVNAPNRFARAMDFPNLVKGDDTIGLVTAVQAPGTSYVNSTYGLNGLGGGGLGSVWTDLTSGNFSNLPSSIISGLGNGDIGSYVIVGGLLFLIAPLLFKGSSKAKARQASRRASLKGAIAREQELLRSA